MALYQHPWGASVTNEYFISDDGTVKVPARVKDDFATLRRDLLEYKWDSRDFLLSSYFKNGTHYVWEIMMMLIQGSAEYVNLFKEACMIDMFPLSKVDQFIPSPRVLNSHYCLDVLPREFRGRKTVVVIRNPKDSAVSAYHHECKMLKGIIRHEEFTNLPFSEYLKMHIFGRDRPYGNYFDYIEHMWPLRDDPNVLILFFENIKMNPVENIQKINEFMGTQRSPELIQQIADATSFNNMKAAKISQKKQNAVLSESFMKITNKVDQMYRKGQIGDWKNHFTVADNEMVDEFLAKWPLSKEIPFVYEVPADSTE
ncbi:hypothetical protein EB796_021762 [Bugula neritina]|uniref:Sulfotransferase domain-containing protein n=1 Tax=Bugula neritina TaxID=10212 RepID=A0A7J7J183_BUGNE|nr:hypothetical protein EB796_021762 [Bugula neritina]